MVNENDQEWIRAGCRILLHHGDYLPAKVNRQQMIRDTSVLLFTIHLELCLFKCGSQFIQTFRFQSAQGHLSLISSSSLTSQKQRGKCAKPAGQIGLSSHRTFFQKLWKQKPVLLHSPVAKHLQSPHLHHTPAMGSCFQATVGAKLQTTEREINRYHLSPVRNSDSTCPEQHSQTHKNQPLVRGQEDMKESQGACIPLTGKTTGI